MTSVLPIGASDFRQIREGGFVYVDKTGFIADVIDAPAQVMLYSRPWRFGKTLNLTTLRYYFERSSEPHERLFEGLEIWGRGERYRARFGRHPVVLLTFKDVKALTWDGCRQAIAGVVARAYQEHGYLRDSAALDALDRESFERLARAEAPDSVLWGALARLTRHLAVHHAEQAVVLLDEYDTPIHAAYNHGYYDAVVELLRNLLSGALKDNPHVYKGVLTGILRVSRESMFSGLNNLVAYSILREESSDRFGFTEHEVEELARATGESTAIEEVRSWYNGYVFGGRVIYNPWSVVNFLASTDRVFRPYWVATGSDDVLRSLMIQHGHGIFGDLEELLRGAEIEKRVDESIVLRDVQARPEALWSFLLFSGYLKATAVREDDMGAWVRLAIPNREVRRSYHTVFSSWLEQSGGGSTRVDGMVRALMLGDAETFGHYLSDLVETVLSHHDTGGLTPERVFQAFVLGLLVHLEPRYRVRSNRESGYGRSDVLIEPTSPRQPGVVLELKVVDRRRGETPERALDAALRQIRERDYAAELRARGAAPIHELAVAIDGKHVWTRKAGG